MILLLVSLLVVLALYISVRSKLSESECTSADVFSDLRRDLGWLSLVFGLITLVAVSYIVYEGRYRSFKYVGGKSFLRANLEPLAAFAGVLFVVCVTLYSWADVGLKGKTGDCVKDYLDLSNGVLAGGAAALVAAAGIRKYYKL